MGFGQVQKYLDTRPLTFGPQAGPAPGGPFLLGVGAGRWVGRGKQELLQLREKQREEELG